MHLLKIQKWRAWEALRSLYGRQHGSLYPGMIGAPSSARARLWRRPVRVLDERIRQGKSGPVTKHRLVTDLDDIEIAAVGYLDEAVQDTHLLRGYPSRANGEGEIRILDKSLPYFNVIMKRPAGLPLDTPRLPPGYTLRGFRVGDDEVWARIETAVGEFETAEEALRYFRQTYGSDPDALQQRVVFVADRIGAAVGTVTAWWNVTDGRHDSSIHWLAVLPQQQGRGLGTSLVWECLGRLRGLEGDQAVFLHTQTWSHPAIKVYLRAGFRIVREAFGEYRNDHDQAVAVLRQVMPNALKDYQ